MSKIANAFGHVNGVENITLSELGQELIARCHNVKKQSHHHKFQVGSALAHLSNHNELQFFEYANQIPESIKKHVPKGMTEQDFCATVKIGDGSATTHGEFPTFYYAPPGKLNASACETPNCPACMITALIREIDVMFVPLETEQNEWSKENKTIWNNISLKLARAAKMQVYGIDDNGHIKNLSSGLAVNQRPRPEKEISIRSMRDTKNFATPDIFLARTIENTSCAIGIAQNKKTGEHFSIYARECPPPGFKSNTKEWSEMLEIFKQTKYTPHLDPITQIAMTASKNGLELEDGKIIANYLPSAGRQLDLCHIGISHIMLTPSYLVHTVESETARQQLSEINAIEYLTIKPNKSILSLIDQNFEDLETHCEII